MKKVVLKISGEYLKEDRENVSIKKLEHIGIIIKKLLDNNFYISVVIGGGNFFRGRSNTNMDKVTGDTIGMLSTVMNSLYLKDYLNSINIEAIVTTPFDFPGLLENYSKEDIKNYSGVTIFGGGIGKSGFSTDSAVVNASLITESPIIIKLTNVDGVYDKDPNKDISAIMFEDITYDEVLKRNLEVMDIYAINECKKLDKKIIVMNINDIENIDRFINNEKVGTIIHN